MSERHDDELAQQVEQARARLRARIDNCPPLSADDLARSAELLQAGMPHDTS